MGRLQSAERLHDRFRSSKQAESHRVIRIKKVGRGGRNRRDRSASSAESFRSAHDSAGGASNKSLVEMFKERDRQMMEAGEHRGHRRSSSQWFRESKRELLRKKRDEELSRQSGCSIDSNTKLNDINSFNQPH